MADSSIYKWEGAQWKQMPGYGVAIAVGSDGPAADVNFAISPAGISLSLQIPGTQTERPWAVNEAGGIYQFDGQTWIQTLGAAKDIGAGGSGAVWVIGTDPRPNGNFGIYQWNGSNWDPMPGHGVRIAAESDGKVWVVNAQDEIYQWTGAAWSRRPGAAKDIGVGQAGIWVIGTDPRPNGNFGIYQWNGSNWDPMPGHGVRIASGHGVVVANAQQEVYAWQGANWTQLAGAARDIAVGPVPLSLWEIGVDVRP